MFREREEFRYHVIQRHGSVDFDIEFPGIVFASLLKDIERGL